MTTNNTAVPTKQVKELDYKSRTLHAAFQPMREPQSPNKFPRSMKIREDHRATTFTWNEFLSKILDTRSHYLGYGNEPEMLPNPAGGRDMPNPNHMGKARASFWIPAHLVPRIDAETNEPRQPSIEMRNGQECKVWKRGDLRTVGQDFIVLDFDNKNDKGEKLRDGDHGYVSIAAFLKMNKSYEYVLHTSYSHSLDHHCFRVIFPLKRVIEWDTLQHKTQALHKLFSNFDDNALCSKHGFYWVSGDETKRIFTHHNKGRFWLDAHNLAWNDGIMVNQDGCGVYDKPLIEVVEIDFDNMTHDTKLEIKDVLTRFRATSYEYNNKQRMALTYGLVGSGLPVDICREIYYASSYTDRPMTQGFESMWNSAAESRSKGDTHSGWEQVVSMASKFPLPPSTNPEHAKQDKVLKLLASECEKQQQQGEKYKQAMIVKGLWIEPDPVPETLEDLYKWLEIEV